MALSAAIINTLLTGNIAEFKGLIIIIKQYMFIKMNAQYKLYCDFQEAFSTTNLRGRSRLS